jgi:hypothetical protein
MISNSSLLLGENYTWWHWWGDFNWWDIYFDFWTRGTGAARCGWEVDQCADPKIAAEEQQRVCSNLTEIWAAIVLMVTADKILAMVAYYEAENMTVTNSSYAADYLYNIKQSKRYYYRAGSELEKGRPHHAITDYKRAWKHAIMARKYALKSDASGEIPELYDNCDDCYYCCDDPCYPKVDMDYPWWWDWYQDDDDDDDDDGNGNGNGGDGGDDGCYCYWYRSKGFWKTNIGKHLGEIDGKPQVKKADLISYLEAISEKYGDNFSFLEDLTLESAYDILCIPDPPSAKDKAEAQILAVLLNAEYLGDDCKDKVIYLLHIGYDIYYEGNVPGAIVYILGLYSSGQYEGAHCFAQAMIKKLY